jgi:hypothetical protein
VAGADGIIRVHMSFSMTDLSQIEKRLGSFSNDSASYIKEFKYLTQARDMTWHETHLSRWNNYSQLSFCFPNLPWYLKET